MEVVSKPSRYVVNVDFEDGRKAAKLTFIVRSQLFQLSPPKFPATEDALQRIQSAVDDVLVRAEKDGVLKDAG